MALQRRSFAAATDRAVVKQIGRRVEHVVDVRVHPEQRLDEWHVSRQVAPTRVVTFEFCKQLGGVHRETYQPFLSRPLDCVCLLLAHFCALRLDGLLDDLFR